DITLGANNDHPGLTFRYDNINSLNEVDICSAFFNTLEEEGPMRCELLDFTDVIGTVSGPQVPVIKQILEFCEFLQINLYTQGNEGVKVSYRDEFAAGFGRGKSGLYIENTSADPNIKIDKVEYILWTDLG